MLELVHRDDDRVALMVAKKVLDRDCGKVNPADNGDAAGKVVNVMVRRFRPTMCLAR